MYKILSSTIFALYFDFVFCIIFAINIVSELIHKCPRCEKSFAKRDYLSKHLKTNCQSKKETVECKPDIPDPGTYAEENATSFR